MLYMDRFKPNKTFSLITSTQSYSKDVLNTFTKSTFLSGYGVDPCESCYCMFYPFSSEVYYFSASINIMLVHGSRSSYNPSQNY